MAKLQFYATQNNNIIYTHDCHIARSIRARKLVYDSHNINHNHKYAFNNKK